MGAKVICQARGGQRSTVLSDLLVAEPGATYILNTGTASLSQGESVTDILKAIEIILDKLKGNRVFIIMPGDTSKHWRTHNPINEQLGQLRHGIYRLAIKRDGVTAVSLADIRKRYTDGAHLDKKTNQLIWIKLERLSTVK
jgi:hypothetical protein